MPTPRKAQREATAVKMLRRGKTAAEVAAHPSVDAHPTTVQRWAKKHGIVLEYPYNRHQNRDDLVDVKEILRLRRRTHAGKALFTLQEIADLCGCSRSYVKTVCARAREDGEL